MPFVPPPQYSLPPNIAVGAFQNTGVGQFTNAFANPVQNKSEYFAGIGKGVALGACFWCVLGGSSAGYVPDEFYLLGASDEAQRGIADGFGLVGAAGGLGELASASSGGPGLLTSRGSGGAPFDPTKLARIIRSLEGQGVTFELGADEYLSRIGAEAAYQAPAGGGPGTIFLRTNPSRAAVIEELLHLGQHRATGFAAGWGETLAQKAQIEMAAQMRMMGLRTVGWTSAEMNSFFGAWNKWRALQ